MNKRQAKNLTWDLGNEDQMPIVILTKARKERSYKIMFRRQQEWLPVFRRTINYGNKRWRNRARVARKWGIL